MLGGPDTGFYLQRLTLVNPVVSTEKSTGAGFRTVPTALPLWAFKFTRWGTRAGRGVRCVLGQESGVATLCMACV